MSPLVLGSILFAILLIIIMAGIPVAFALGIVSLVGTALLLGGGIALTALLPISWGAIHTFSVCCIPLFILMGEVISTCGLSKDLYDFASKWLSKLDGGLAIATIIACGIFAAISGSSVATAATIGLIAIPEMRRLGYEKKLTLGSTAAGGTLGILIPPSIPLIIYGIVTENSIGRLFAAGMIPGIILMLIFSLSILIRAKRNPSLAPVEEKVSWSARFHSLKYIWPVVLLITVVLGSIYGGIATPSEAAGLGCFAAIALGMFYYRRLNFKSLYQACMKALKTSAMIGMIIVGAMLFGYLLCALNVPHEFAALVTGLGISRWWVLIAMNLLLIFMGMFLEVISIVSIMAPIFVPVIIELGWDPIWFAIVMTINMEMALITPPVGLNLYVIKGIVPDSTLSEIVRGVFPFIILALLAMAIVILFPQLSLWLPNVFYGN